MHDVLEIQINLTDVIWSHADEYLRMEICVWCFKHKYMVIKWFSTTHGFLHGLDAIEWHTYVVVILYTEDEGMMCDECIRIVGDDCGISVKWGQTSGDVTTLQSSSQQEQSNERTKMLWNEYFWKSNQSARYEWWGYHVEFIQMKVIVKNACSVDLVQMTDNWWHYGWKN